MCYFSTKRVRHMLLFFFGTFLMLPTLWAQESFDLKGVVLDSINRQPITNVSVSIKGVREATSTDNVGQFTIRGLQENSILEFSAIGYHRKEVAVAGQRELVIHLAPAESEIEEVAVVAYGSQRKSSMVASITTVNPKELKGPTSNLTTMLAGKVAGVIAYQRTGEPGADNASFFIRGVGSFGAGKKDPLILIDGVESSSTDLARLQPDDIAGFSVLKDAAASALYGARGANGVVLVTTKSGIIGRAKFNVRFENSLSTNTRNFKFADNITYMQMANEAVLTRNPRAELPYDQNKIE